MLKKYVLNFKITENNDKYVCNNMYQTTIVEVLWGSEWGDEDKR